MPIDKLTDKQRMFVKEYLVDLNATQAAIRAGYSENNADKIGSELLGKTRVKEEIQKGMDNRSKRLDITADKVLQELAHIAFDDIKNYLSYSTEKTVVSYDKDGEPITDYKTIVNLKNSDEIDTRNISEISTGPNGVFRFKQYCKDNALVQLGKHLKLFTENIDIGNKDDKPLMFQNLTTEQIKQLLKEEKENNIAQN